jgi:hypothetical protein
MPVARARVPRTGKLSGFNTVAADAVLVVQKILKLGAHLVTALARLHVNSHKRRSSLEAEACGRKKAGRSEEA